MLKIKTYKVNDMHKRKVFCSQKVCVLVPVLSKRSTKNKCKKRKYMYSKTFGLNFRILVMLSRHLQTEESENYYHVLAHCQHYHMSTLSGFFLSFLKIKIRFIVMHTHEIYPLLLTHPGWHTHAQVTHSQRQMPYRQPQHPGSMGV